MPGPGGIVRGYGCASCRFTSSSNFAVIPAVEDCVANLRLLRGCHGTVGALDDCAATIGNSCFRVGDGCRAWSTALASCPGALIGGGCDLRVE